MNHITHMNWIDYTIIGIILISTVVSIIRGFIREALSLIVWGIAIWVAIAFAPDLSKAFEHKINYAPARIAIAYVILILGTVIIGSVINYLIGKLVNKSGISATDRLLGILFGAARGVLIVAIAILLVMFTPFHKNTTWKDSVLVPQIEPLSQWLAHLVPEDFKNSITKKQKSLTDDTVNGLVSESDVDKTDTKGKDKK